MPFPESGLLRNLELDWGSATSNSKTTGADTFFPSWGADDRLYTPFADGNVRSSDGGSWVNACCDERAASCGPSAHQGFAVYSGDDPLNLSAELVGSVNATAAPFYRGRYPSASLSHKSVWYLGTYMLTTGFAPFDWDVQGPLVSIRTSLDGGRSWHEPVPQQSFRAESIFGEFAVTGSRAQKVKFGAPHFVDFGRDMAHSPDGRAYLIGHGSSRPTNSSRLSWMSGDEVYLARTAAEPDPSTINDGTHWEFFAGHGPDGAAQWVLGNVSAAQPLFSWLNRTGVVTMTYLPAVQRYLVCVSTPTTYGGDTLHDFDSYILEGPSPTGPFSHVAYLRSFGPEAYFLNIPSKFVAASVQDGFLEFWLSYSANFACQGGGCSGPPNPPVSGYTWVLQKARLAISSPSDEDTVLPALLRHTVV